ncbi:hypothetical protein ASG56_14135 [Rhodococcus sp. Leaf7]|nr:hypothetical protein ASG56_14135 [Rhodococcus sp. Leaf7]KQU40662.1 hypothetical protein ASG64_14125 [Rhodococcus sp. Leaf247]
MTKLMAWAALAGAVIGLVFLGAEGIAMNTDGGSVVVYEGSYEPLRGVEMIRETPEDVSRALEDALNWWNQLPLPWWAYPLIGAVSAAVLSTPFAIAGVRLGRQRR